MPAEDFGLLRFELLVGGEERFDLAQPVVANVGERPHVCITRIADRHGKNLEVRALLIVHIEPAERPRRD